MPLVDILLRNHLPKFSVCLSVSCVKKTPGALNNFFQSIAFELAISGRLMKEKPRKLSLNRISKEKRQYFPYLTVKKLLCLPRLSLENN